MAGALAGWAGPALAGLGAQFQANPGPLGVKGPNPELDVAVASVIIPSVVVLGAVVSSLSRKAAIPTESSPEPVPHAERETDPAP